MKLLCLSDIHGCADALGAVLASAERWGYDHLLVAGDICFPGPSPVETWRRLVRAGAQCVQGSSDRALATLDLANFTPRDESDRQRASRVKEVRSELGWPLLDKLAKLPRAWRLAIPGGHLTLVHGSPADPLEPMTHDMTDEALLSLLGEDDARLVVCGASHVPFDREVQGTRIVNVGSVGQAFPNACAEAAFIEVSADRIDVRTIAVPLGMAA